MYYNNYKLLKINFLYFNVLHIFFYYFSGAEYENCILDCSQMPNSGNLKPDDPSNSERGSSPDADGRGNCFNNRSRTFCRMLFEPISNLNPFITAE